MSNGNDMLLLDLKTATTVKRYMPDTYKITHLSSLFSVFSEPCRLKILSCLSISEMCVTDLSRSLNINQTTISHQLKILKDFGLVRAKRQGKIIFYKISDIVVSKLFLSGVEYLGY